MEASYLEKKLLQFTKDLPDESIEEVINFAKFQRFKEGLSDQVHYENELSDLNESEITHLEEEFKDYKNRFPVE